MKMRQSRVIAILVAIIVGALPLAGRAQVVAVLSGRAPLRAKIARALKQEGVRVLAGNQVGKVMRGEHPPLSDGDWARIAGKLRVDAFVSASAARGGAGAEIEIVVRSGTDGAIAAQESVPARVKPRQLRSVLTASLSRRFGSTVAQAAPSATETSTGLPPAESPALAKVAVVESETPAPSRMTPPASEKKLAMASADDAATATSKRAAGRGLTEGQTDGTSERTTDVGSIVAARRDDEPGRLLGAVGQLSTFDIEADARTLRRTFDYSGAGPRYLLSFNPVAGARASYYPMRNAGVFGAGEFGAGLETGAYPTGTRELMGGAVARLPLPFGQIGASAAYFHHAFLVQDTSSLTDASRLTLAVPNTVYSGVRLSASARIALARRVQVVLDGAYRLVTTVGDGVGEVKSAAYFPGSSTPYGLDGRAFIGVGLGSMFEVRAGIDYRRYVYGGLQGTTASGTTINATSAVDQYLAFSLGLAAVLGPR